MGRLLTPWGRLHKMTEKCGSHPLEGRSAVVGIWSPPLMMKSVMQRQVLQRGTPLPYINKHCASLFPDLSEASLGRLRLNFSQATAFRNGYQTCWWQQPRPGLPRSGTICRRIRHRCGDTELHDNPSAHLLMGGRGGNFKYLTDSLLTVAIATANPREPIQEGVLEALSLPCAC